MGTSVFPIPSAATSPIKSIQRGYASSSGNITITAVDTGKSFVRGYSAAASGSAGATGNISEGFGPSGGSNIGTTNKASYGGNAVGSFPNYSGTGSISAGSTNLISKEFNVYFANSTTITATGACYWEVVEYV